MGIITDVVTATEAATHDGYPADEGEDEFEDENELDEDTVQ
jgi:hypothetical protein